MTLLRTLSDEELIAQVEAGRDDLTTTALELELELVRRLRTAVNTRIAFLYSLQNRIDNLQEGLEALSDEITTLKEQ